MFVHGISNGEIAKQLANLLNTHNKLSNPKRESLLLSSKADYVVETHGKFLIGACGAERVGYTFSEIKHLVVDPQWRGKGVGKFLVERAMCLTDTPLLFASIREDNKHSMALFESLGFEKKNEYTRNSHKVIILTKANKLWKKDMPFYWGSGSVVVKSPGLESLENTDLDRPLPW